MSHKEIILSIEAHIIARITVKFIRSIRRYCKKFNRDFEIVLSRVLKMIIETELIENANQNQTNSNSNC